MRLRFRVSSGLGWIVALGIVLSGCNPEIEVLAVEKELFAVYGVLHPDKDEQHIRITKVFQTQDDALVYASSQDLTAYGMQVVLKSWDTTYVGELVPQAPREPGLFFEEQGIYRIPTPDGHRLRAGETYQLIITKPDDPEFRIAASTIVPTKPRFLSPGAPLYSPSQGTYTYPSIDFHRDHVIRFENTTGEGYELRVYLDFWNGSEVQTSMWGPTRIFREPEGCREDTESGRMCYEIPQRVVPVRFYADVTQAAGPVRLLDTIRVARSLDSLSRIARVEVTAVDTHLTNYLHSNTAFGFGLNLLMDRPEVTNISGENIGLFGAINTQERYIFIGPCTRYLAGLSTTAPGWCF
ncbi:MAG: hypothetical protein AAF998_05480 [Bacteroidota bacterium]